MRTKGVIKILLVLIISVIVFHISIVVKIVPYEITWGGQLQNDTEMYVFETISIFINVFLGFILLMKSGFIKSYLKPKVINIILWIFFLLFAFNTIGNFFAKTYFEKSFSILTIIFAVLIGIILKNERIKYSKN